jgi:hypothetical protein
MAGTQPCKASASEGASSAPHAFRCNERAGGAPCLGQASTAESQLSRSGAGRPQRTVLGAQTGKWMGSFAHIGTRRNLQNKGEIAVEMQVRLNWV